MQLSYRFEDGSSLSKVLKYCALNDVQICLDALSIVSKSGIMTCSTRYNNRRILKQ